MLVVIMIVIMKIKTEKKIILTIRTETFFQIRREIKRMKKISGILITEEISEGLWTKGMESMGMNFSGG